MKIIADTREQLPLDFKADYITEVKRQALLVGDYGCEYEDGWVAPIYFERKSLGDLFGTMTHSYTRFKKEMERAVKSGVRLVIAVESSYTDVLAGYSHSEFSGQSMALKLETLRLRHDLDTWFCNSRWEMVERIKNFYYCLGREKYGRK